MAFIPALHIEPLKMFQPVLHTGVTKAVVCTILFVRWCTLKIPCCLLVRVACDMVAAGGFLSCYLSDFLPYVQFHIAVNKMCQACR